MVKTETTSKVGLASTARSVEGPVLGGNADLSRSTFGAAAFGMSWQLAIVVLLPILGGYKLDSRFGSVPLWTLFGLVVSLAGSVVVIRRALAVFGNFTPTSSMDGSARRGSVADHGADNTSEKRL